MKRRKRTHKRRSSSKKLAGYTKTGGKYALVFSRKGKRVLGTGRYRSKTTLVKAAQRYLKK